MIHHYYIRRYTLILEQLYINKRISYSQFMDNVQKLRKGKTPLVLVKDVS